MASFITDEIKKEIKVMIEEHLNEEQEGIDDLFGDQIENKDRRVTMNLRINLSAKSETSIEIKTSCDYILEPSVPAIKKKGKKKKLVDTAQQNLDLKD